MGSGAFAILTRGEVPSPVAHHRRRLVRASGVASLTKVIVLAIAVVDTVVTARLLGASGKGGLFLFATTVSIFAVLATCSLGPALQVATTQERVAIGDAVRFCVTLSTCVGVMLGIAALGLQSVGAFAGLAASAALLIPAEMLVSLLTPLFVVADRIPRRSVLEVSGASLDLALTAGFMLSGGDRLLRATVGIVVARWLLALLLTADLWGRGDQVAEPHWRRQALQFGLRNQPASLLAFGAKRADAYVLAAYLGPRAVGIYSVASTLAEIPLLVARAVQPSVISMAAALGISSGKDVARIARAVLGVYVLGLPVYGLTVMWLLGPALGEQFGEAATPLWTLLIATTCLAVHTVLSGFFLGTNRPGRLTLIIGPPVLLNLLLSFILIPRYGLAGNAWASAIGALLTATAGLAFFRRIASVEIRESVLFRPSDFGKLRSAVRSAATVSQDGAATTP